MPLHRRFKSYVGVRWTVRKLADLLATDDFGTCSEVLAEQLR
jgi:hypothetical protein